MSTTTNQATTFSGTGTGAGTPLSPSDREGATIRFQVVLASTGTIGWQHTIDGTNWTSIQAVNESSLAASASATASGIYTINASASYGVRPNISANGSGITIVGTVVRGGGGGSASGGGGGGGGAVTVADGADVAQGTTTDGAQTDATQTGTLVAFLKGVVKILADVWNSTSHFLKVSVTDGTNTMPTMDAAARAGFFKRTDGTNTAPTMDAVGRAGFQKLTDGTTVVGVDAGTAAINVNIAKDSTAASIATVGGSTVEVGVEITRPADTTAYAANDSVNTSTSAPTFIDFAVAGRIASGTGYVTKARLLTDQSTNTARFRLWLFSANTGTKSNDNAAFTHAYADKALALGSIDFPACTTEGSSNNARALVTDVKLAFVAAVAQDVYGLLETLDVFTPASGQKIYVALTFEQN